MQGVDFVDVLGDLLDGAVACLSNPPARQFIAHGGFAVDCEMVAVAARDWSVTDTDPPECATTETITMDVTVARCFVASTETEPTPAASGINADAYTLAHDIGDLVTGLGDRWADGTLFTTVPNVACGQFQIIGAAPGGPAGGYAWWRVTVTLTP